MKYKYKPRSEIWSQNLFSLSMLGLFGGKTNLFCSFEGPKSNTITKKIVVNFENKMAIYQRQWRGVALKGGGI